ncbi:hypothetical protein PHMEG_0003732 [Phytophthora megakarya]|uniref:Uncharacterized protein n=1 Tax=Phytophthora megakarya TaxID=4795 RepID=A0A225WVG5_9STRA|nr:hypothetical protein PHMEG_0003732 [Phytophthora megakarya]
MQRLLHNFVTKITLAQSMKMFTAPKSAKRSWTEHYLYLVAVSEACGHLVNDANLLEDAADFESQCVAAEGGTLKVTKRGSVMVETTAMGKKTKVKLLDVQNAENFERNINSYGLLEKKGFRIKY